MINNIPAISRSLNKIYGLVILILSISPFCVYGSGANESQEGTNYLYLQLKSGGIVKYSIDERPIISFEDGNVNVGNDFYLISDINKYTFSNPTDESGVEITNADNTFTFSNGTVRLSAALDPRLIHISNLQGIEYPVPPFLNCEEGYIEIDLRSLLPGAYILSTLHNTIKFMKK